MVNVIVYQRPGGSLMAVISAPSAPTHTLGGASFTSLATPSRGCKESSVWQVEIAPHTPATPHSLTREEVFVVLDGIAHVSLDGVSSTASVGDAIVVPAGVDFAVSNEDDLPLRMLCCLPVGGTVVLEDGSGFVPPWAE
jgi:mannose-6-phosphate isomerase-like protein (cupin superfamily)